MMKKIVNRFPKSFIFPTILLLLLITLSFLQISGTSMGVYDYFFDSSKDNILAGEPRTVRSDEWTVTTPFTIAQTVDGYSMNNEDIGSGQDMSVVVDVPYFDWSMVFKPQNLIFFIAPLGFAFAFKWWLLAVVLAVSVYVFVLFLYPKKYLLASLLGVFFVFNPFIQWWYQSITILPIAYVLFAIVIFFNLIRAEKLKVAILYGLILSYILISFALLMYPAFQISVTLVALGVVLAILASKKEFHLLTKKQNLLLIAGVSAATLIIVGLFIFQHLDVIHTTLSTAYPGGRNVESGGFNPIKLATWPLSYLLLDQETQGVFKNNQSEISNFLLFGLATLPFIWLLWLIRQKHKVINFSLSRTELFIVFTLTVLALLIFTRMFVPFGDAIFSLLGLSKVPHVRLFIALGIINILLLAIVIGRESVKMHSWKSIFDKYHGLLLFVTLVIYSSVVFGLSYHYNISTVGWKEATALAILLSVITTGLLSKYNQPRYVSLLIMCLFAIVSSGLANPLYKGLSLDTNPAVEYIKSIEVDDNKYWISNDKGYLSSVLLVSGAEVFSGVNTYPQLEVWRKYFPNDSEIYNRYAHVRFKIDNSIDKPYLRLIQADSFQINTPSCSSLLTGLNINYILSEDYLGEDLSCYPNYQTKTFDQKKLYIYSR